MSGAELRVHGLRLWSGLKFVGALGMLIASVLVASGWRIQKPAEVDAQHERAIAALDKRTAVLEGNYVTLNAEMKGLTRMQCLLISRHDANLAGTCAGLPTRDESPRTSR